MKDNLQVISSTEMRKNLITGALAGGMLGLAFGFGFDYWWLGLVAGILFGVAVGFRLGRLPIKMRFPMYITRRILLAGAFCMLTSLVFALLLDRDLTQTQFILAAIIPILAWLLFVISIGTAIASLDELQRRIQTEAIAIGFAGTVFVCGGYGLLGLAKIVPALNLGWVIFVMVLMWFLGKMWTLWRYR
jgi:hypothetical protein